MVVSARTFEQLALEDSDAKWELDRGVLRQKPGMSMQHNRTAFQLGAQLWSQLEPTQFSVRVDAGHLSLESDTYYVPDVSVIPAAMEITSVRSLMTAPTGEAHLVGLSRHAFRDWPHVPGPRSENQLTLRTDAALAADASSSTRTRNGISSSSTNARA